VLRPQLASGIGIDGSLDGSATVGVDKELLSSSIYVMLNRIVSRGKRLSYHRIIFLYLAAFLTPRRRLFLSVSVGLCAVRIKTRASGGQVNNYLLR
jgi:hypothetical protein